jgi:hypothetical protein
MKLELKHLAPYLPYGLKCTDIDDDSIITITGLKLKKNEIWYYYSNGFKDRGRSKPILRPLSDINPDEILLKYYFNKEKAGIGKELQMIRDGKYDALQCSYNICNILISEHFDVFGLIEQGLANRY